MPTPIFPNLTPGGASAIRGLQWNVKKSMKWNTVTHSGPSGVRTSVSLYPNNPLWEWEFSYGYVLDDPNQIQTGNAPYTDLQVLEAFYFMIKGQGQEFLYQPPDSVAVNQPIAMPDANNHSELTFLLGAVPNPAGGFYAQQLESVQELNGATSLTSLTANGINQVAGTNYTLLAANTVAPYEGIVINWLTTPTAPILAGFTRYYRVAFSDDSHDYEEFMFNLWQLNKLKFEQVRIGA